MGEGRKIVEVRIPYVPRKWAVGFHASLERFVSMILHRRAGKTTAILNHHVRAALDDGWEERRLKFLRPSLTAKEIAELLKPPGGRHYGHVMPTRVQAKVVAWDKLKYYASPFPEGKPNEAELVYRFGNGNKVQLFGADDPDAMRGTAFSGLSFDEYSQQPRNIFSEVLSKALGDHLGYAIFAGTIKGKDHLYETYRAAQHSTGWFSLWQDVGVSLKNETGVTIQLLAQAMEDDRKLVAENLMTQEEFDQEWFLSLEAAIKGAYYARELAACRKEGRITAVPWQSEFPVYTAWDLGYTDDSAIWFYQNIGEEIHIIDFYVESGGTIEEEVAGGAIPGTLTREVMGKPYRYARHWLPHDARAKTLAADGKSVVERLGRYFGPGQLAIVPNLSFQDGVQSVRAALGRCWFDEKRCEKGLNALLHYQRKYDNKMEVFAKNALHSWASHPADAMRMLAIAERREVVPVEAKKPTMQELFPGPEQVTLDELWERHEERLNAHLRI
jgi:hypothetical protein